MQANITFLQFMASTTPSSSTQKGLTPSKDIDVKECFRLTEIELASVKQSYLQANDKHEDVKKLLKTHMDRVEDAMKVRKRLAVVNGKITMFRKLIDGEPMDFKGAKIHLEKLTDFIYICYCEKERNIHDIDWENIDNPIRGNEYPS